MTEQLLSERDAAVYIGWSAANLRSHRERRAICEIVDAAPGKVQKAVLAMGAGRAYRVDLTAEPWRMVDDEGVVNARGKEAVRFLAGNGYRPTVPPRSEHVDGATRYSSTVLDKWLDDHPAASGRNWMMTEAELAQRMQISCTTVKTARYRQKIARNEDPNEGTDLEIERRAAHADGLPEGSKVGRAWRYHPDVVEDWIRAHPRTPAHPLLRERDISRGRLLTPEEFCTRTRKNPAAVISSRCRAGAAITRIAEGNLAKVEGRTVEGRLLPRHGDARAALSMPPHVPGPDGRPAYQQRDVTEWLRDRGTPG